MPPRRTVLNVAEKNDAAKAISAILSRGNCKKREGLSKYNKIFEFECEILNTSCKMVMTSVSGHLLDLGFIGMYRKWHQCAPLELFSAPVERFCPEDFQNIKRTLEREAKKASLLIIWTDGDREGENIGFEIIQVCKAANQNLDVYRAKFSEITVQSIFRACNNFVRPDQRMSNAVEIRRELDLRIGAAFTRFQTIRLQKKFPNVLSEQLISYGSCQFPTLGFVVDRFQQVQSFIPEVFYKLKVSHTRDECKAEFSWARGRLFRRFVCMVFHRMCNTNPKATVIAVTSKPKSKWRPVALDTVELEKICSKKLRINAKETMRIAERLYTRGYISYPRTETNIFPQGFNLNTLIEQQIRDSQWGGFATKILEIGPNPRQGKKTDNAHPPIHPTKYTADLQGNEKRIYEFIVRHFLACCSEDARGQETTVKIEIAGEHFTSFGLMILAKNYLEVYPYERWTGKMLGIYKQGERFDPDAIDFVEGETSAPPLLTEADLIGLMEKHGIGTDATHAEHIETIKVRNYVGVQQDGTFVPGELGMGLVEGYDAMGFEMSKPYLRAGLELDLRKVCEGLKQKGDVLTEQLQAYKDLFLQALLQVEKLDRALSTYFGVPNHVDVDELQMTQSVNSLQQVLVCPKCRKCPMALRKIRDSTFMVGCCGYPQCKNCIFFPKFVLNATVSNTVCTRCLDGSVRKIEFEFKRGALPPWIDLQYTGCIGGCDKILLDLLDINRVSATRITNISTEQRPNTKTGLPKRGSQAIDFAWCDRVNVRQTDGNENCKASKALADQTQQNRMQGRRPCYADGRHIDITNHSSKSESATISQLSDSTNLVACNCGQPAKRLIARKYGPNFGRRFYRCVADSCNFFLWGEDESTAALTNPQSSDVDSGYGSMDSMSDHVSGRCPALQEFSSEIMCNCNAKAVIRTVAKQGPNTGRPFYCCAKSQTKSCGFFQWAGQDWTSSFCGDRVRNSFKGEAERNSEGQGGLRRGESAGINKSSFVNHPGSRRKRRCGKCNEEGHTKKTCSK